LPEGSRADPTHVQARRITIGGRVQGVGFRPFIFRLATQRGLNGWVRNRLGVVEVHVQGSPDALDAFARESIALAPPLAQPHIEDDAPAPFVELAAFEILPSTSDAQPRIHVPPDYFACDECVSEMGDPGNRRYRYPFINCTQCGPRYTLITRLPYDRPNTTMAAFPLCEACRAEYEDPADRRFHAEPLACPTCGPRLSWRSGLGPLLRDTPAALAACVAALRAGQIVAVKGVGGYHLLCDACDERAVARLRANKHRPHKPLAVMFPPRGPDGLDAVRAHARLDEVAAAALRDPARPIVLVDRDDASHLAPSIAPGVREIGAFLPYSPLHHLLLADFGAPLVATSGNLSGEPVLTDGEAVETRLGRVARAFLHHDRPIERPADDPVVRRVAGRARPLRLGRGNAPLELQLPGVLDAPVLACGGHMKNTVALAWDDRVVVSPHIGDLETPRSLEIFGQVIADLQRLYAVRADRVVCDAHPGYASSRWARQSGLPVTTVLHHAAHASALAAEHPDVDDWLVFTWDGVGLGADGSLWGGEALRGRPGAWQRAASWRPFHLPGGERAAREPWRSAAAVVWESGAEWPQCPVDSSLLREAWRRRVNCPETSAVGRLFDAAAALTDLNHASSFEGQGPMWLEAAAGDVDLERAPRLPLQPDAAGLWRTDWSPLVDVLRDDAVPVSERAGLFHAALARALADQATAVRGSGARFTVGLSGGVFQNRRLAELALAALAGAGFEGRLNSAVPCNDAGLSLGQVVEFLGTPTASQAAQEHS